MHAYKINLWKWFFSTMIVMEWCAITFAKFLTPLTGGLIFNPGGKHGIFVVQNLENVVGAPGLTAILLFTAIAFLTYLTTETITVIRKALNPIGYITSKVHFEITNHGKMVKTTSRMPLRRLMRMQNMDRNRRRKKNMRNLSLRIRNLPR